MSNFFYTNQKKSWNWLIRVSQRGFIWPNRKCIISKHIGIAEIVEKNSFFFYHQVCDPWPQLIWIYQTLSNESSAFAAFWSIFFMVGINSPIKYSRLESLRSASCNLSSFPISSKFKANSITFEIFFLNFQFYSLNFHVLSLLSTLLI